MLVIRVPSGFLMDFWGRKLPPIFTYIHAVENQRASRQRHRLKIETSVANTAAQWVLASHSRMPV